MTVVGGDRTVSKQSTRLAVPALLTMLAHLSQKLLTHAVDFREIAGRAGRLACQEPALPLTM
jgi:hypothetical protein